MWVSISVRIDGDDLWAMNVWALPPAMSSHRRPAAKSAMNITTFATSFNQL
jgi:hypothetical protein